jgi:trimethylamine:corrinoid methyltransferase-like protein
LTPWPVHRSVAHLRAFEEGDAGGDEDEDEVTKIGSKEWLAARKRHIIKKTSEEGFQDRAIRCIASAIAFVFMLLMLYGAIGLLSGDGVEQYPCETIRALEHMCRLSSHAPASHLKSGCVCVRRTVSERCRVLQL